MIEDISYTTQESAESNGRYITVYAPDGSYVSRHRNMEECTESAISHANDNGLEGELVYRFVPPEKHMRIRRTAIVLPVPVTQTVAAQGGVGVVSAEGASPTVSTPTGTNATRIALILDNYTVPFAYTVPTDPSTTRQVTVNSASEFNTQAGIAGTEITIGSSFSGNIAITADDIDVVMDNAYTITGDLTMDTGSRVSRIRWTGGNVGAGNAQSWRPVSDVLFDDVFFFGRIDLDSRPDPIGATHRVAFINSTITTVGSSSGEDIDFTLETVSRSGISRHSDIIVANCLIENGNNSPTRFGWSERTVFVESYTHTTGVVTGFRFSSQSRDSFIAGRSGKPFIFIGRMHLSYDLFANDHAIHDATLDNVNGYIQYNTIGIDPDISGTNTGTVSNSTLYVDGAGGESMSTYPFSAGSGNTALTQAWDGSTLPSSAAYGAQR